MQLSYWLSNIHLLYDTAKYVKLQHKMKEQTLFLPAAFHRVAL